MKTPEDIQIDIDDLLLQYKDAVNFSDGPRMRKAEKVLNLHRQYKRYSETFPSQKFIEKELIRLQKKINLISDHYPAWLKNNQLLVDCKKTRQLYDTEMGVNKIKSQIKSMEHLLG